MLFFEDGLEVGLTGEGEEVADVANSSISSISEEKRIFSFKEFALDDIVAQVCVHFGLENTGQIRAFLIEGLRQVIDGKRLNDMSSNVIDDLLYKWTDGFICL